MSALAQFALEAGGALSVATVIGAWTFRSSSAPTWAKIAFPVVMMALVVAAPWKVSALLGRPRAAACADLPTSFDLIGYSARDADKRVYLWIKAGSEPVAYDVPLNLATRVALTDARDSMIRTGAAHFHISCKPTIINKNGRGAEGSEEGETLFTIDDPNAKGADE